MDNYFEPFGHSGLQSLLYCSLSLSQAINLSSGSSNFFFRFRPRWERCADYIDGGQKRWNDLSSGKRSENLVDILLAEISGADISTFKQQDHFEGLVSRDFVFDPHNLLHAFVCMVACFYYFRSIFHIWKEIR